MKIVLTTIPAQAAENLASALVTERVAACVNIVPAVTSVYRWNGVIERAAESLLIVKTSDAAAPRLMERIESAVATLESLRKKKLEHWQQNCETNRSWLALNMMTEARAGFKAFNEGPKNRREVDFIELRRALAAATPWSDELIARIMPRE